MVVQHQKPAQPATDKTTFFCASTTDRHPCTPLQYVKLLDMLMTMPSWCTSQRMMHAHQGLLLSLSSCRRKRRCFTCLPHATLMTQHYTLLKLVPDFQRCGAGVMVPTTRCAGGGADQARIPTLCVPPSRHRITGDFTANDLRRFLFPDLQAPVMGLFMFAGLALALYLFSTLPVGKVLAVGGVVEHACVCLPPPCVFVQPLPFVFVYPCVHAYDDQNISRAVQCTRPPSMLSCRICSSFLQPLKTSLEVWKRWSKQWTLSRYWGGLVV